MSSSAGAAEQIIESHEPIESANLFVDAFGSQQVAYPPPARGEQPWRELLAADKAKVIDLPPILRARIDLYNSRLHAIDARSPPDAGRLRVVVRQLVPVLRHRQHPHGAERGNHRDIHDDPHGPIPWFTQWENCVSLARSFGRERKSCGCGFQATKARVRFGKVEARLRTNVTSPSLRSRCDHSITSSASAAAVAKHLVVPRHRRFWLRHDLQQWVGPN